MLDNPTENPAGCEGESYDETMSEDLLNEDELDPEEAERRITQFVISADEFPGPPVEELPERVTALMRAASRDLETIMDGPQQGTSHATLAGSASSQTAAARPNTMAPPRGKHATDRYRCPRR